MKKIVPWLWLIIPLWLSPLHYVHAYLDPGAGSYAIQMAIGIIFGATYALKSFGSRIIAQFKSRYTKKDRSIQ